MKRTLLTLALATGLATAGAASAQRYYAPEYDYARVVDVDPIVDYERRPVSREVCYDEPVRYRDAGYHRGSSTTPMIAGAVIGGVVGNQFGSGSGRDAATVAGALLGGSIGRDRGRYYDDYDRYPSGYRGVERRCRIETAYTGGRERVVGYDVTYRYNGRLYTTRTATHPGRRIRVQVDALHDGYAYR